MSVACVASVFGVNEKIRGGICGGSEIETTNGCYVFWVLGRYDKYF